MKISVVIPAYNEEKFLARLLDSLQNQSMPPHEIIVVNNNSTDNTETIARRYHKVRVVFEKHRSFAFACQRGFDTASGDIIARADADYVVPKDWLRNIVRAFEKDKKLAALGGPLYPLESTWLRNLLFYPAALLWMYLLAFLGRGFLWPNMAVRRAYFYKTGGFNTSIAYGEDADICLRLKKEGKVAIAPAMYVYTSMRRLEDLGFMKFLFGYSILNQLALFFGKEPPIGHNPVRAIPKLSPHPDKPLPYLLAGPLVLAVISLTMFMLFTTPVSAQTKKDTPFTKLARATITKQVIHIKNTIRKVTPVITPKATF